MPQDQTPLPERVAAYYSQLTAAAKDLNTISDELGKSISEIDHALKKLNLGVIVWLPFSCNEGQAPDTWFWSEDIGYAKIGPAWGIALRKVSGDNSRPDDYAVESWLFNDAPRALRVSAIGKIPDLLEKLSEEAINTTKRIRARLNDAQAVAEAVKSASRPRIPTRPITGQQAVTLMSTKLNIASVHDTIIYALIKAGHKAAAQLLDGAAWTADGSNLRIECPGTGKKMISLTVNAAAEGIIREELLRMGNPMGLLVVSGPPLTISVDAEGVKK